MKKFIQVCLVAALLLVLVLGTVPMLKIGGGLPGPQPNVGWNTGIGWETPDAAPLAFTIIVIRPDVGWNT